MFATIAYSLGGAAFLMLLWNIWKGFNSPVKFDEPQLLDEAEPVGVYSHVTKEMDKGQIKRRGASIVCYQGRNGHGKSLCAVYDIVADLEAGIFVLSTVGLLRPYPAATEEEADAAWQALFDRMAAESPEGWDLSQLEHIRPADPLRVPHPYFIPLVNFNQVVTFRDGTIFLDEIQGVADARDSMGLPPEVRNKMYQLRRDNCRVVWTTISYTSADKRMREVTKLLVQAKGTMAKRVAGSIWPRNTLFFYRAYDPADFQDYNQAVQRVAETQRPKAKFSSLYHINGKLKKASYYYDSGAGVLSLGASGEGGRCLVCGKKRRAELCKGDHEHDETHEASPAGGAEERPQAASEHVPH